MKYTVNGDPRIDAKVENDLQRIKTGIKMLMGNAAEVILVAGGFGRGEGSVVATTQRIRIINDYDIIILLRARGPLSFWCQFRRWNEPLEKLAECLAKDMDMKQIDLAMRSRSYFSKRTAPTIEKYEIRNGHSLLAGRFDPCNLMPNWKGDQIPLFEGTWLFRNRGLGLLIAGCYIDRLGRIDATYRENFAIECNKALLAIGDSVLLLESKYHWSYANRLKIIEGDRFPNVPCGEDIVKLYAEALREKLKPEFNRYHLRNPLECWLEITTMFIEFFLWFEGRRLGSRFNDWIAYDRIPKAEDRIDIRTCIGGIARSGIKIMRPSKWKLNLAKARKSKIIAVVGQLLSARVHERERSKFLAKVAETLCEDLTGNFEKDWLSLTSKLLFMVHPGGEAGRLANRIRSTTKSHL